MVRRIDHVRCELLRPVLSGAALLLAGTTLLNATRGRQAFTWVGDRS